MQRYDPKTLEVGHNISVPMTRRLPPLKDKTLQRDAKIAARLIKAWDVEHNKEKVLYLFNYYQDRLSDYRYWELLRTVWIIAGSIETCPIFLNYFKSKRKHRVYFSTPEEIEYVLKLPIDLKVYRACDSEDDGGLSWTLDLAWCQTYQESTRKAMIIEKLIKKADIFAYINRAGESEVLLLP